MYFPSVSDIDFDRLKVISPNSSICQFLIFIGEKSADEMPYLLSRLEEKSIKCLGGIFPNLILDTETTDAGILICEIPPVISRFQLTMEDLEHWNQPISLEGVGSAILLSDGTIGETNAFLKGVHSLLGSKIPLVGGGAGRIDLSTHPCLFTEEGSFHSGGLLALLPNPAKVAVRHGWTKFDGPFLATKVDKNIIHEINWRPALDVYKEVVEKDSGKMITSENFLDVAKSYPFGLFKEGTEYVIRDPFAISDNQSIVCITEIPENSVFYIMQGNPESLLQAAAEVGKSIRTLDDSIINSLILFTCISRILYLGDRFQEELAAFKQDYPTKIRGVSTLGEIACTGTGFVEFYNKTIVSCHFLPVE